MFVASTAFSGYQPIITFPFFTLKHIEERENRKVPRKVPIVILSISLLRA